MSFDQSLLPQPLLDYYARVGAEVLNFRRAMIKNHSGKYYLEKALIKVGNDGEVTCSKKDMEPTDEEAAIIKAAWRESDMPRSIHATMQAAGRKVRELDGQSFIFQSYATGDAIMIQQRAVGDDGERRFVPWTFWSDGQWRPMEPDGPLPFWKPEERRSTRIMVHEGAKAARHVTGLVRWWRESGERCHPWIEDLAEYDHWGMIGGALAPHRTDYAELIREAPTEVVYVCDNDWPGMSALSEVSRHYGRRLKGLKFDSRWPMSFDLADPMPDHFIENGRWIGPSLGDQLLPATWATEAVHTGGKGRPVMTIRREFAEEWFFTIQPEVYVHRDWPSDVLTMPEFNNMVRPFSGINDTAMLLKSMTASQGKELAYDPSQAPGFFTKDGQRCLNTHVPTKVMPEAGSVEPFLRYMEHLVPSAEDRRNLLRWIVTLVARPDLKILYGVLLISDMQGVGKSTLGEKILKPLLGNNNVSTPGENEIVDSDFNYWAAHKRLAVVHEIYAGNSSKPYNKLKSLITDDYIMINKKYQAAYQLENWLHILACSNSLNALKLSVDDRRWFVPKVTEVVQPPAFWQEFNYWLDYDGGLGKILNWCQEKAKEPEWVVYKGETAPMSAAKKDVIEEGFSPGMRFVSELLQDVMEENAGRYFYVVDSQIKDALEQVFYQGRMNDRVEKLLTLRKVAKNLGLYVREERLSARTWAGIPCRQAKVISNNPGVSDMSWADLQTTDPVNVVEKATRVVRFAA